MKKYSGLILLISLILISIMIYIGLFLLCVNCDFNILLSILFQIIGVVLVLPLFVLVHEAGHMVFGLLTGYKVLSFKVGPFEWYNNNDKISFRVNPLSNFVLGQCLMSPPKKKKKVKPNFYLYNAGGLIFSYLFDIIFILLFFVISNVYIKFMLIPIISISIFLTVNNSIYQKGGINDVCNYVLVKNNPKYIESVMYQLEIITNICSGKRYGAKTSYEAYYEENLNHISLPVVQFRFLQAIDKDDFNTAKKLSDLMRRNYHNIMIPTLKLSMIFEILFSDLVIDMDMNAFRRHFRWLGEREKMICSKYVFDLNHYLNIYNKVYNKDFDIKKDILDLIESEAFSSGERLSIEKKFNMLLDKIIFYISNGNSFIVKE